MADGLASIGTGNGVSAASRTSTSPFQNKALKKDTITHRNGLSYEILTGANETSAAQVEIDGVTYTKRKIIRNGKEEYVYINSESAKAKNGADQKNLGFWDKWDNTIDGLFDNVDKILGVDEHTTTIDGKDDGKLSVHEAGMYALKGAVVDPVKCAVKNPITTAAITVGTGLAIKGAVAGLTAIGVACPPAGAIMLGIAAVIGVGFLAWGAYKAATAKTDAQARSGWRFIGTGTVTTITAGKGLHKMHKANVSAFKDAATQAATAKTALKAAKAAGDKVAIKTAKEQLRLAKSMQNDAGRFLSKTTKHNVKVEITGQQDARGGLLGLWDDISGTILRKPKALIQGTTDTVSYGTKNIIQNPIQKVTPSTKSPVGNAKGYWKSRWLNPGYKENIGDIKQLAENARANIKTGHIKAARDQIGELANNIERAIKLPGKFSETDVMSLQKELTELRQALHLKNQIIHSGHKCRNVIWDL